MAEIDPVKIANPSDFNFALDNLAKIELQVAEERTKNGTTDVYYALRESYLAQLKEIDRYIKSHPL